MIAYSQESYQTCSREAYAGTYLCRNAQFGQPPVCQTAYYAGHSIYLLVEYYRLVVKQHIADYSTGRTGDTAHDDSHPERLTEGQTLLYTGDGEECQS